jgi:hypothetical protein
MTPVYGVFGLLFVILSIVIQRPDLGADRILWGIGGVGLIVLGGLFVRHALRYGVSRSWTWR